VPATCGAPVRAVRDREAERVGIGLALSRRIALAHGGDLVLEAGVSGASFLLTLPAEER